MLHYCPVSTVIMRGVSEMSGAPKSSDISGTGEAIDNKTLLYGVDADRSDKQQEHEDTRPGSTVGGHEPGKDETDEREEMTEERRGA
jgi:hypothetical protein